MSEEKETEKQEIEEKEEIKKQIEDKIEEKQTKIPIDKRQVATSQRFITQETVMLEKLMSISSSNFKADAMDAEPSS